MLLNLLNTKQKNNIKFYFINQEIFKENNFLVRCPWRTRQYNLNSKAQ